MLDIRNLASRHLLEKVKFIIISEYPEVRQQMIHDYCRRKVYSDVFIHHPRYVGYTESRIKASIREGEVIHLRDGNFGEGYVKQEEDDFIILVTGAVLIDMPNTSLPLLQEHPQPPKHPKNNGSNLRPDETNTTVLLDETVDIDKKQDEPQTTTSTQLNVEPNINKDETHITATTQVNAESTIDASHAAQPNNGDDDVDVCDEEEEDVIFVHSPVTSTILPSQFNRIRPPPAHLFDMEKHIWLFRMPKPDTQRAMKNFTALSSTSEMLKMDRLSAMAPMRSAAALNLPLYELPPLESPTPSVPNMATYLSGSSGDVNNNKDVELGGMDFPKGYVRERQRSIFQTVPHNLRHLDSETPPGVSTNSISSISNVEPGGTNARLNIRRKSSMPLDSQLSIVREQLEAKNSKWIPRPLRKISSFFGPGRPILRSRKFSRNPMNNSITSVGTPGENYVQQNGRLSSVAARNSPAFEGGGSRNFPRPDGSPSEVGASMGSIERTPSEIFNLSDYDGLPHNGLTRVQTHPNKNLWGPPDPDLSRHKKSFENTFQHQKSVENSGCTCDNAVLSNKSSRTTLGVPRNASTSILKRGKLSIGAFGNRPPAAAMADQLSTKCSVCSSNPSGSAVSFKTNGSANSGKTTLYQSTSANSGSISARGCDYAASTSDRGLQEPPASSVTNFRSFLRKELATSGTSSASIRTPSTPDRLPGVWLPPLGTLRSPGQVSDGGPATNFSRKPSAAAQLYRAKTEPKTDDFFRQEIFEELSPNCEDPAVTEL